MDGFERADPSAGDDLLALYDDALPHVYGYLLSRCGHRALAEDLASETFLTAVDAVRRSTPFPLDRGYLIGVARHKLADHWRREGRERSHLREIAGATDGVEDPWEARLNRVIAQQTLSQLTPQHRAVLTLRYVDDLSVPQCADVIDRTVHATEALLVRARSAFRRAYPDEPRAEGRHD